VYAQSPAFWSLTLDAHRDSAVLHLCRAFDSHAGALSLSKWLQVIRENLHLFDVKAFDERMAGNPFVRRLLRDGVVRPNLTTLKSDEANCSSSDADVKKLARFRGNVTAHTNAVGHRDGNLLTVVAPPLTIAEIERLLGRASEVLSKYSILFSAEVFPTSIFGQGDHRFIFAALANAIEAERSRDVEALRPATDTAAADCE
ncbi:MAG: hypothetical protein M3O01_00525, partial [Pseudomonadota bacterium]|nr:hypothetical protein [Pseudomonadota bacterium]